MKMLSSDSRRRFGQECNECKLSHFLLRMENYFNETW
jgi:hypothetical protein